MKEKEKAIGNSRQRPNELVIGLDKGWTQTHLCFMFLDTLHVRHKFDSPLGWNKSPHEVRKRMLPGKVFNCDSNHSISDLRVSSCWTQNYLDSGKKTRFKPIKSNTSTSRTQCTRKYSTWETILSNQIYAKLGKQGRQRNYPYALCASHVQVAKKSRNRMVIQVTLFI